MLKTARVSGVYGAKVSEVKLKNGSVSDKLQLCLVDNEGKYYLRDLWLSASAYHTAEEAMDKALRALRGYGWTGDSFCKLLAAGKQAQQQFGNWPSEGIQVQYEEKTFNNKNGKKVVLRMIKAGKDSGTADVSSDKLSSLDALLEGALARAGETKEVRNHAEQLDF